jgi:hypothetical protein
MPAGQALGMVEVRELVPRLREDRLVKVLQAGGSEPVNAF